MFGGEEVTPDQILGTLMNLAPPEVVVKVSLCTFCSPEHLASCAACKLKKGGKGTKVMFRSAYSGVNLSMRLQKAVDEAEKG